MTDLEMFTLNEKVNSTLAFEDGSIILEVPLTLTVLVLVFWHEGGEGLARQVNLARRQEDLP